MRSSRSSACASRGAHSSARWLHRQRQVGRAGVSVFTWRSSSSGDVREHVDITEGPDGLYREVVKTSPRLSDSLARLGSEHGLIKGHVDDLLARLQNPGGAHDVDTVRDRGTALISVLLRHRQGGSDLVFEAYEVDIGGET